jgi:hypothetical protein
LGVFVFLSTISYFTEKYYPIFIFIVPNRYPGGNIFVTADGRTKNGEDTTRVL